MKPPYPLEYTNCCHPVHCDGVLAPAQIAVVKLSLVLSWSEKRLLVPPSLSLVTPVTLSKEPVAEETSTEEPAAEAEAPAEDAPAAEGATDSDTSEDSNNQEG